MEGDFGMRMMLILALLTLASCGADGEPIPPMAFLAEMIRLV
jgi:predicted small lipoprotein YifL